MHRDLGHRHVRRTQPPGELRRLRTDEVLVPLQDQREVLTLVARGHSNDYIARELFVSPLTAKTHVARIMTKLDAHDRAQLVIAAYGTGLVTPGTP